MSTAKKSDSSIRSLTPNKLITALTLLARAQLPTFVWGAPGIGKSDCVRAVAKALGDIPVIDVRLSQLDPTDLRGIPYVSQKTDVMNWSTPNFLPTDPDTVAILFLDEMNSAPLSVQAAAYQLILDRKVGSYTLPKGVIIIAAGNRDGDKGVTNRMPTPLANRLVHFELVHDSDEWLSWAMDNKLHVDVVSYVGWKKEHLMQFDPSTGGKAFASPRTWSFVSRLLKEVDDSAAAGVVIPSDIITNAVCGAVGEGVGISFMAHRKLANELPKATDILSGKVTKLNLKSNEISARYALAISLIYELTIAKANDVGPAWTTYEPQLNNFFTFIMSEFSEEVCVMTAKLAVADNSLMIPPIKGALPAFKPFSTKYADYIVKKV